MSDQVKKISRLQGQIRSLRRKTVIELLVGVVVVVGLALLVGRLATQERAEPEPTAEPETIAATPPVEPLTTPPVTRRQTLDLPPAPPPETRRSPPPPPSEPRRVEVGVERVEVLQGADARPALWVSVSIANTGRDPLMYRSPRSTDAVVLDDLGRHYRAIDYGAMPQGGVRTALIQPGETATDVLVFEAPAADVRHLDLQLPGSSVGLPTLLSLRINAVQVRTTMAEAPPAAMPPPRAPASPPPPSQPRAQPRAQPRPDPAPSAQEMAAWQAAATNGDAEAQWKLGRAHHAGHAADGDPKSGLAWLLKAARQGHTEATWKVAMILKDGDGVPANTRQATRWLKELAEAGHHAAHRELAELAPTDYVTIARDLRLSRGGIRNKPGSAVETEGRLGAMADDGTWPLAVNETQSVSVDLSSVDALRIREGTFIRIAGYLHEGGTIEACLAEVPQPAWDVQTNVTAPNGVVAFRSNRYVVDGVIVNTGRQPIRSLTFLIRLVQDRGSGSVSDTVGAMDLMPGERRPFTVELSMNVGSNTAPPRTEVTNPALDW